MRITGFLDDTRPDAPGLLTIGNIGLRSLVSLHPEAMTARAKESTSPGPKTRRRKTVKTEK